MVRLPIIRNVALLALERAGHYGMTWRDLAVALQPFQDLPISHGQASGTLSRLHAAGLAVRLEDRRAGSTVYVAPSFVNGRAFLAPGRAKPGQTVTDDEERLMGAVRHALSYDPRVARVALKRETITALLATIERLAP